MRLLWWFVSQIEREVARTTRSASSTRSTHSPSDADDELHPQTETDAQEKVVDHTAYGPMTVRRKAWKEKVKGNVNYSSPPWRWMKAGRWRFLAIFHQEKLERSRRLRHYPLLRADWLYKHSRPAEATPAPIREAGSFSCLSPAQRGWHGIFLCFLIFLCHARMEFFINGQKKADI